MPSQQQAQLAATYRVSPKRYDVEAAAQQYFYYLKVHADDTTVLALDPTARDRAFAKCASAPDTIKPAPGSRGIVGPEQIVPLGGDVDAYLAEMDAVIDKPAFTAEERVKRVFCLWSALEVFRHYKINLALPNNYKLRKEVMRRISQLFLAYMAQAREQPNSSAPPTDLGQGESLLLSEAEAQDLLSQLEFLCGFRFKRSEAGQNEYTWRVVSFAGSDSGIQYKVLCEGDSDPVTMDREELTSLLRTSALA